VISWSGSRVLANAEEAILVRANPITRLAWRSFMNRTVRE